MEGWIAAVAFAGLALVAVALYNRFVRLEQNRFQAEGDVAAQLSQRWDLAPQMAALAARYMTHESDVLLALTKARHEATPFVPPPEKSGPFGPRGDAALQTAMTRFFARAEAYPELRADGTFVRMQAALEEAEAQIAAARRALNASTAAYNAAVGQFPANIVASMFGFRPVGFVAPSAGADARPDVSAMV